MAARTMFWTSPERISKVTACSEPTAEFLSAPPPCLRISEFSPCSAGAWAALLTGVPANVLTVNPNCGAAATAPAPNYVYTHAQEARQNPPLFFRRALKLQYGISFNLGTACYGAAPNPPCGLTIAAENPVYIQGDYNNAGAPINFTGANVASVRSCRLP